MRTIREVCLKLFFIVGENSGDNLAGGLIRELKQIQPEGLECVGVGGPRMKAAGMNVLLPFDQISVIGIWEVIPKIPRLMKIFKAIAEEIIKQNPDAVITVDFPDFNFLMGKSLRKRGYTGKIIHYVAPSVWAWRKGRAKSISQFLDGIICLFPMEPEYFTAHNLKAAYVGHPVVETKAIEAEGSVFREANDIPSEVKTLGLFFGSRESEFKNISSPIKLSGALVAEEIKNIRFVVPTLPETEYNVQILLKDFDHPVHVSSNQAFKWESFKACDIAIAVSGTVALELAYAGIPHVIVYKTNPLTYLILRLMVKVKKVHLANILLNEDVVPEFIQGKCHPESIAQKLLELFSSEEARQKQLDKFDELRKLVGFGSEKTPSRRAAEFVLEVMKEPRRVIAPPPAKKQVKNQAVKKPVAKGAPPQKKPAPKKPEPASKPADTEKTGS
ncbi:MAG: lipid-A-disaccharide synthase [Alphaproteobacteria bacterium]|nr:lipid-A-disaccharide synthase [Alphaproteobacteria bacterium]